MSDISKITLLDNQTYDLKDLTAREHIQDHNNPHQVTAGQAEAISRVWDYSFKNVSGWYRFLTVNILANRSYSILLFVQDTYSYNGGPLSYKAIISLYITRTSAGVFASSANFLTGYGFTKDSFYYTYDSSSGDVSIYVFKNTNNNGYIGVTVISSLSRAANYVDLSDSFESTAIATLPEGGWYFQAMQDGAGNVIPDTYATKDELLSTLINKGAIDASTDIDTLTSPGMWWSATGLQPNWPNQGKPGRLVVFGSNSTTMSRKVQLVVCNTNGVDDAEFYYRIGIYGNSTAWGSWTCVLTEAELEYSTDGASGDIVTFETESAQVLPSVVVDIDPVQDLHGYDHPWPAGGGKNLFRNPAQATTMNNVTITPNSDGSITLSGTANSSPFLYCSPVNIPASTTVTFSFNNTATNSEIGIRLINTESIESGTAYGAAIYLDANNKTGTVTQSFNAKAINLFVKSNHGDVPEITLKIQCEIGSSATAWTPYENICPISGWDGCTVERTGKNLFSGWETVVSNKATSYRIPVDFTSNTYYTVSGLAADHASWIFAYDNNNTFVGRTPGQRITAITISKTSFTYDDGTKDYDSITNIVIEYYNWPNVTRDAVEALPTQIESGSTATTFESCQNSTYAISFPSSASTVYGGTLNVTNGVLTVDRAMTLLNATTGVTVGTTSGGINYADITYAALDITLSGNAKVISSDYKWVLTTVAAEYGTIKTYEANMRVYDARFTSVADAKAVLETVQMVYPLETPQTYQLTPTQVTALLGQNNLWADTGDVSVVYREGKNALLKDVADAVHNLQPKLLFDTTPTEGSTNPVTSGGVKTALDAKVNDSVIALVEPTSTASEYHNGGDPFMLNGNLYQASGSIAEGETIVPGTNAYPTNAVQYANYVGEMLSENIASRFDELSASDVGAINKSADYTFSGGAGWHRFFTISLPQANISRKFVFLVNESYASNKTAIIAAYMNRTTIGDWTNISAGLIASRLYSGTEFAYYLDTTTNTVSYYYSKGTNSASYVTIQVLQSINRSGVTVDISGGFEDTVVSALPTGVEYFTALQDGAGNYIPDTYATKAELGDKIYFGKSTTAAATQTKTCSITGISSYYDGLMVRIWFTNAQSYNGTPKLNINNLGAKNISPAIRYEWAANSIVDMVFGTTLDGWTIVRGGHATTTYYGVTKLSSSVSSTSTALAATPSAVKTAYDRANAVAADLATVEASSTASNYYDIGQHLVLNGVLYEVTAPIATSETITQGTNVTPAKVMESMAAMDTRLSANIQLASEAASIGVPYDGVDLTVKFATEIAQYTDPWAWIKARISAGDWSGLRIGDYIPFTTTESTPKTYQAQIAGINTYKNYGDTAVGNHIDFICRELWSTRHPMNPVDFNNGTKFGSSAATEYPWRASDLYRWLNSLGGTVPNATTVGGGTGTSVNYTSSGVYYYLPDALKDRIAQKKMYLPKRYNASSVLTDDNAGGWEWCGKLWLPSEFEVYGAPVWGGKGGYATMGNSIQYPYFAGNMNRVKKRSGSRDPWWVLSVYSGDTENWCGVSLNGSANYYSASATYVAVPICFRII